MTNIHIKEQPQNVCIPKGRLSIFSVDKESRNPVDRWDYTNLITNEVAEFFTGKLSEDPDFKVSHIYGQWGEPTSFSEGGGPFFTPQRDNTVSDLTTATIFTTNAQVPIITRPRSTQGGQSEFSQNIVTFIGAITQNDGKVYVGLGLVSRLPTKELLLSHVALDGILKKNEFDLLVVWEWIFQNN